MKCDKCEQSASFHITELKGGQLVTHNLCEDCARQHRAAEQAMTVGLADLLSGITQELAPEDPHRRHSLMAVQCEHCGLGFEEFRSEGKFGCAECYPAFRDSLSELFRSIHGSCQHRGKKPLNAVPHPPPPAHPSFQPQTDIDSLRSQLTKAVEAEDFEKAIALRDQIRELEANINC